MINKLYILLTFLIPLVDYAQVNYETEIQPLFNSNCIGCHSGGFPSGGLNLTDLNNLLEGSENGPVIVEGSPNSSLLWQEVFVGSMPPGPNDLSEEQVNLIEQWIFEYSSFQNNDCLVFESVNQSCATNNSIAIPNTMNTDLQIGDEIGLFYINESNEFICSNTIVWTGDTNALSGCGDDTGTTALEGFQSGDELNFFVLKNDGNIYNLTVSFQEIPGFESTYIPNGLSAISSMFISDLYATGCNDNTTDIFGCTDSSACNYNENATSDDGSCLILDGVCESCSGETDGTGIIIDNDADDDGICNSDEILGCTDSSAINFNENATDDDGSCLSEILGCIDSIACNYDEDANTDDGSCTYIDGICETCENGTIIDNDADNDGICNDDEIVQVNGCTDENAFNFDSNATSDDGSCCFINGCSQPDNILYNPDACFFDDQLCVTIDDCDNTIIPFTTINNVSCFNEGDGSIEVIFNSVFGGTPPYTVVWEQLIDSDGDGIDDSQTLIFDPNNDGLLENLDASNYKLTVVDDFGCSGTTIVSVSQPAEINVNYDTTEILCNGDESNISIGIEGNIMNYDVLINGNYIETVNAGSPTITNENDFEFTETGTNNTIIIFGCDDSDCSDANGVITPGDIIGIFYENVNGDLECGGSAVFNGTIPFAALSGWQSEFASDNGFEDGDPYIWYLFDTSGDIYQLNPNYDLNQGVDYFTPGGFTVITNFEVGTILGSNDDFYYTTQSGEYLIEVLAENGCVASTTLLIDEPSQIELISSEVSNPTCGGSINGSVDIEISGGTGLYTYEWIGPLGDIISSNEDLTGLSPGIYSVTVTDENNCVFSNSFEINNPETIEVSYSYEPISCNGENTSLTIEVNGGVPPYIIDYSGLDPNNISSGFYTFSVTDDLGCLETFNVSISDPDGIAINYPAVETVCYGETNIPVDFSMSISGGNPPYSYEWFDNNGISLGIFSPSATVSPGDYSIVITDSDNCISIPSFFTISEPEQISVDFDLDSINCFGETATANFTIDGSPGSYTIFFNGESETTTIGLSDISFDWTNTGVNSSIVISEITGLNLNEGDLIGVFYTSANGVQCGGTTSYSQSTGFPISLAAWGEETGQDNGFVSGEEFLFLISSGGLVYEVEVEFNLDLPGFTDVFEINGLSQIENMNVTGVFSDGPDFSFDSLEENNYFVEILDGNGCSWDSTIVVNNASQLIISNEIISNASCFGELAEINSSVFGGEPPYTYEWQNIFNGQIISSQPQPQLEAGSYFFIVTDNNGCSEINLVEVPQESGDININFQSETCANENNGFINSCVDWDGSITFSLSDSSGLIDEININGNGLQTCNIFENLSPSNYILSVVSSDGCIINEEIEIESADPILVAFDTNPAQCFDQPTGTIFIDEIIGGNPPFEIDWNGVDTEAVLPGFHSFIITDQNGCAKTFNYFIGNSPNINTNPTVVQNNCFNGEEGSINLSVTGGNPLYNYIWTNSSGDIIGYNSSISNLPSDTYFVEITDSNGCTYNESHTITDQNENFVVLLNTVPSNCYAGEGTVSASVLNQNSLNYNFIWPNGVTNNGQDVSLPAGNYNLSVVNNSSGCTITQPFTVSQPDEFIIEVFFDEIQCFEDNNNDGINDLTTSVSAYIIGGADFDTDGDGINNDIDNDIDNDGIVNDLDDDIDGDGIFEDLDNDGVPNYQDEDIDGDGLNNDIDNDIDNDGIVNVNDQTPFGLNCISSCNSDDENELYDDNNLFWINGDVDYDGVVNDEDPDWDGEEVFVNPNSLTEGIYFVYSFDSNGCYTVTEFEITSPEDFIIDVYPNQIQCYGEYGTADLSISGGTPPYEISWTNQLTGEEVNPSMLLGGEDGIAYNLVVTDQNQCIQSNTFIINPEPEEIIIENLDEMTSNYNGYEISCNGYNDGYINLDVSGGNPPYSFSWFGPNGFEENIEDVSNLFSGIYSVLISDSNGCQLFSSIDPFEIEMNEPEEFEILFTWAENARCEDSDDGSIIITTNGAVPSFSYIINNVLDTLEGGSFNTNLDIDDYQFVDESSIVIQDLEIGLYSINIISDQNNCLDPQFVNMNVGYDDENCLWIPSIFSPNSDGVNDTFEIYGMEYYPDASVFIYDRWGVKKYESKNQLYVPWNGMSNGNLNEIGTYYYVIELNTGQKTYSGSIALKR